MHQVRPASRCRSADDTGCMRRRCTARRRSGRRYLLLELPEPFGLRWGVREARSQVGGSMPPPGSVRPPCDRRIPVRRHARSAKYRWGGGLTCNTPRVVVLTRTCVWRHINPRSDIPGRWVGGCSYIPWMALMPFWLKPRNCSPRRPSGYLFWLRDSRRGYWAAAAGSCCRSRCTSCRSFAAWLHVLQKLRSLA
jgi:hypothetical protein